MVFQLTLKNVIFFIFKDGALLNFHTHTRRANSAVTRIRRVTSRLLVMHVIEEISRTIVSAAVEKISTATTDLV